MTVDSLDKYKGEGNIINIGKTIEQVENRKRFYELLKFIKDSGDQILKKQYNNNF